MVETAESLVEKDIMLWEAELVAERESNRSFDPRASIDMLQFDLKTRGQILNETWQRVHDEELSFVAESIDRPLETTFSLNSIDNELVYFSRGEWRPYIGALLTGLHTAQKEAALDPRKHFLVQRAEFDLQIGFKLKSLRPGETLIWDSPFPEDEFYNFGGELLRDHGFQTDRFMGFIYRAERMANGSVILQSNSVDNCDPDAYKAVQEYARQHPGSDMGKLLSVYDQVLESKHGEKFKAGRPLADEVNAWEFIAAQKDLVNHYMVRLEEMARAGTYNERAKRELTYSFWAALKDRLKLVVPNQSVQVRNYDDPMMQYQMLAAEMGGAMRGAMTRHELMIGCGGMIYMGLSNDLLDLEPGDAMNSIMSDRGEKLVWKSGVCRIDGCPTRPGKTLVAQCHVCIRCQSLYDKGRDPVKIYRFSSKAQYN